MQRIKGSGQEQVTERLHGNKYSYIIFKIYYTLSLGLVAHWLCLVPPIVKVLHPSITPPFFFLGLPQASNSTEQNLEIRRPLLEVAQHTTQLKVCALLPGFWEPFCRHPLSEDIPLTTRTALGYRTMKTLKQHRKLQVLNNSITIWLLSMIGTCELQK